MTDDHGWGRGAARKIARLVSARMLAQVLGVAWFLAAARVLDSGELGVLAAGLVALAAVSVVADMGTTWSIAREVTDRPERAWPFYVQALMLRGVAALTVGGLVVMIAAFLVERRVLLAIGIGVLVAVASGASEVGMSTLRAVGVVRPEAWALPGERLAFVVLAAVAIGVADRGANVILLIYLATNLFTAVTMFVLVRHRLRGRAAVDCPRLWSVETRRVGIGFAVLALGPRANALILVMLASRLEVADYSVAARPVEQFALTFIGFSTTLLPLLRTDALTGGDPARRAGGLALASVLIAAPGVVWAVASPGPIIDLVYGADRYPGAPTVLALVAVVSLTWPLRGLAGLVMVARERAGELARLSLYGLAVNAVIAVPLVLAEGAAGAALALLITDVVTAGILVLRSGVISIGPYDGRVLRAGLLGVGAGLVAAVTPLTVGVPLVVAGTVGAALVALQANRRLVREGAVSWA